MRRLFFTLLCLAMVTASFGQETALKRPARKGEAAGYSSRDTSVISMMGWGVGLAVGIAAFCALMDQSTSGSNAH